MKLLPNILTSIRLLLVPTFVFVYFYTKDYNLAAWIFLAAGITDVLDGYIARKYHLESRIGALLDPLADKLLQLCVTACLVISKVPMMWVLFVILLCKESILIFGSAQIYKQNRIVIPALWYGKAASFVMFLIIWLIIYFGDVLPNQTKAALSLFAAGTTVFAGIAYIMNYFRNVKIKEL